MKRVSNIWYVTMAELAVCGVNLETVRKGYTRGSSEWQAIKDPDDARCRLIRYDTLAAKYQGIVRVTLCGGYSPDEFHNRKAAAVVGSDYSLTERLERACTGGYASFVGMYTVRTGNKYQDSRRTQSLARAAAMVETIGNYILEKGINWRSYATFNEASEWLKENAQYYLHANDLPTSAIRLKNCVVARFLDNEPITNVVCRLREGNKNREGKENNLFRAWFIQARMSQKNLTTAKIARQIGLVAAAQGLACPTLSWFQKLSEDAEVRRLTNAPGGRYGSQDNRARAYTGYLPTKGALYAGDCWQVDATRVNFIPHKDANGKDKHLTIVAIRDLASGDIMGAHYQVGGEDGLAYFYALKMAVSLCGYLPYQLITDRFPGNDRPEIEALFDTIRQFGTTITIGYKATDKAAVERWFETFQSEFLSESDYYYGEGIRSTRQYNHRSAEWLAARDRAAKKEGWNTEKAWNEVNFYLQKYRQTPRNTYAKRPTETGELSPMQLHEQLDKPFVFTVELWQLAELFQPQKPVTIARNGFKFQLRNELYHYVLAKEVLARHKKLTIRYDETDLKTVYCYDEKTGEFVDTATLNEVAVLTGPNAQWGKLAAHKERESEITDWVEQGRKEAYESAPDFAGLLKQFAPKVADTTAQDAWLTERMPDYMAAKTPTKTAPKPEKRKLVDAPDLDAFFSEHK